ncbi:MAG: 23S rRNA (uracil(1939)-C(5))-methyltransferase RlmD [Oscillospiraceae bacterium]|nr:23S rRNA (uracil(1939)-C(5))-methyltransferase RlmD [Oscillospiraceae bacterium]
MKQTLIKNECYTAAIEAYSSDASGICHIGGMTVFVPYALKGETIKVRIVKALSSYAYGRIEEILQPSPERCVPVCPHYYRCGGCTTQHMTYTEELAYKSAIVRDSLLHIAHLDYPVGSITGSEQELGYRNKATYSFTNRNGKIVSGFYRDRSHDVIPVENCSIQPEISSRIASFLTDILNRYGFTAFDETTLCGHIRHLFIRTAHQTGEVIVCITSARGFGEKTEKITAELVSAFPEIVGVILDIDKIPGNKLLKGRLHVLWGRDYLIDELCGLRFRISPLSFYQINSPQAERLYEKVREYAVSKEDDNILDLYCGIGTISLYLSRYSGRVIGVEIVEQAIENAKENAMINDIRNAEFFCSDAIGFKEYTEQTGFIPDCIVVDPPRKGLDRKTITDICSYDPERIVYVSCNPATLARDIGVFIENGYEVMDLSVFDMFPKTNHVETVCLLYRQK